MGEHDEQYIKMTQTPVQRLILTLAVPTIISMLITSIYNMADTYFVSKLGTSAAGAIGIVLSLMAIIQAIGFMIGMGSSSHISIFLGEEENEKADEFASSAVIMSFLLGSILAGICFCYDESLMKFLGATDTILPYAIEYGRYILATAPFMCVTFVLDNLLRAEGKSKLAMIGIAIGGITNVILDPVLIFGMRMGMKGAGISTAISQAISFGVLMYWFLARKTTLNLLITKIAKRPGTYLKTLKNGLSSFARQGLASAATVLLNVAAARYGDSAVAGMSIVGRVFMFIFSIIIGFVQGYNPVAGYNYGADNMRRVRKAFVFTLTAGTVLMTILGVAVYIYAGDILNWFIGQDLQAVEIGTKALQYQCFALPLISITVLCNMTYQAMGKPFSAVFLASCRQGIFFIPAIYMLPYMFGIRGVEVAQPLADIVTAVCCIPFMIHFFKMVKSR